MDGAKFAKLCRESKLLSRAVTASDADLFFAKACAYSIQSLDFETSLCVLHARCQLCRMQVHLQLPGFMMPLSFGARKGLTADGLYVQVKTKGARKIKFAQFVDALGLIAAKNGVSLAEAAQTVLAAEGPSVSGTKADYVKFHDDKASKNQGSLSRLGHSDVRFGWSALHEQSNGSVDLTEIAGMHRQLYS